LVLALPHLEASKERRVNVALSFSDKNIYPSTKKKNSPAHGDRDSLHDEIHQLRRICYDHRTRLFVQECQSIMVWAAMSCRVKKKEEKKIW
jgi:hypothetical protein